MTSLERLRARLLPLLTSIRTVASPNESSRNLTPIRLVVIHTTESGPGSINGVAAYFQNPNVQVSSHYIVGDVANESGWTDVVRAVSEEDAAWTAKSANRHAVQYELVGRASRPVTEWRTYGAQLRTAAALVAEDCLQYGIPVERGFPGILGHGDLSEHGFPNDHWDPGQNFPWGTFLSLVKGFVDEAAKDPPSATTISVKRPGRPQDAPARIPRWAWQLDKWFATKPRERGARPTAPVPLPDWFWPWRAWLRGVKTDAHPPV